MKTNNFETRKVGGNCMAHNAIDVILTLIAQAPLDAGAIVAAVMAGFAKGCRAMGSLSSPSGSNAPFTLFSDGSIALGFYDPLGILTAEMTGHYPLPLGIIAGHSQRALGESHVPAFLTAPTLNVPVLHPSLQPLTRTEYLATQQFFLDNAGEGASSYLRTWQERGLVSNGSEYPSGANTPSGKCSCGCEDCDADPSLPTDDEVRDFLNNLFKV